MNDQAIDILLTCATINQWSVSSDNLLAVADLLNRGYVTLYDDYDVIGIVITEAGIQYAKRKRWIEDDPEALFRPYSRTTGGWKFSKER